jgi:hypothetical protein
MYPPELLGVRPNRFPRLSTPMESGALFPAPRLTSSRLEELGINVIRSLAKERPDKRNSGKITVRRYILFIASSFNILFPFREMITKSFRH